MIVTGTIINAAGIIAGGMIGVTRRKGMSAQRQTRLKMILGAFTLFYGLRLVWTSAEGTFSHIARVFGIAILSLMLGHVIGIVCKVQAFSNRIGQYAKQALASAQSEKHWSAGFIACTALFCAAPLAFSGSVADGLNDYWYPLAIKGVIDGLTTMEIAVILGFSPVLSALPVFVFQGSITIAAQQFARPYFMAHNMIEPTAATAGFLIFTVSLVILQLKKISLAAYLPSLVAAPLLSLFWQH